MQNDVSKCEKLAGDEDVPAVDAISDDQASHRSFSDPMAELSMNALLLLKLALIFPLKRKG
jgi:hypothetical protein